MAQHRIPNFNIFITGSPRATNKSGILDLIYRKLSLQLEHTCTVRVQSHLFSLVGAWRGRNKGLPALVPVVFVQRNDASSFVNLINAQCVPHSYLPNGNSPAHSVCNYNKYHFTCLPIPSTVHALIPISTNNAKVKKKLNRTQMFCRKERPFQIVGRT